MTLVAGTRLGPYEVIAPLGAGGMGEVYRARDTRLSREVAVKVLPAELAEDSARLQRFEKEARSASALNHPNIVTIYDIGSERGVSYIAMERVDGPTLRELVVPGPLPMRKLFQIAPQIAEGLSKAHEAGIVHRDLKPENVMVTKDWLVKILDFGLAKLTSTMSGSGSGSHLPTMTGTTPGVVVGTVAYMSPEQASGESLDYRSDQFSLGSILYEMAAGKRAFQKKTPIDTLAAILNEEPEAIAKINPQAPAPLRWIVERCLSKERENRYASTKDLARELTTLRDHLSEASASGPALATPARSSKRLRLPIALLAFLGALSIGFFAGRPVWKARFGSQPLLRQVTFRRAGVNWAKFGPDGQSIIYSESNGDGPGELHTARPGTPETRSLGLPPANILSVSLSSELAILVGGTQQVGTLATVSLSGGAPRELLEHVWRASWAPDGKSLAVVHQVDRQFRIELPIGKVLYQGTGQLWKLEFSPKGDRILFGEQRTWIPGARQVSDLNLLDLAGKTSRIASVPFEAHWSPDGDEIFFNEIEGGTTTIRAVTLSGRQRSLASFAGDFAFHDVSRDGRLLLERGSAEYEIVGGFLGQPAERSLSWLDGSVPADLSSDGALVLFTETTMGGGPAMSVYKRKTDGSPAVRLGEGRALALSPDGRWALAAPVGDGSRLVLLPTGPGQPREITLPGIRLLGEGASFFPNGKRVLLRAMDADRKSQLYVLEIESGKARAVTPEGIGAQMPFSLSPDGRSLVCYRRGSGSELYDVDGGPGRAVPGLPRGLLPIKWSADGRALFVRTSDVNPVKVYRLALSTGRLELWKEFSISEAGISGVDVFPTPDGKSYVCGYTKYFSNLFIAEGVK